MACVKLPRKSKSQCGSKRSLQAVHQLCVVVLVQWGPLLVVGGISNSGVFLRRVLVTLLKSMKAHLRFVAHILAKVCLSAGGPLEKSAHIIKSDDMHLRPFV